MSGRFSLLLFIESLVILHECCLERTLGRVLHWDGAAFALFTLYKERSVIVIILYA